MEIRHDVRHVTGRVCVCVCVCLSNSLNRTLGTTVCLGLRPFGLHPSRVEKSIAVTSTRLELITPSIRQYGRPTGGIRTG